MACIPGVITLWNRPRRSTIDTSPSLTMRTEDATRRRGAAQPNGPLGRIALHRIMLVVCTLFEVPVVMEDDIDGDDGDDNNDGDGIIDDGDSTNPLIP